MPGGLGAVQDLHLRALERLDIRRRLAQRARGAAQHVHLCLPLFPPRRVLRNARESPLLQSRRLVAQQRREVERVVRRHHKALLDVAPDQRPQGIVEAEKC